MWCVKYSGKTKIIFEKAHKFGHLPSFWALSTQENPCTTSVYVIRRFNTDERQSKFGRVPREFRGALWLILCVYIKSRDFRPPLDSKSWIDRECFGSNYSFQMTMHAIWPSQLRLIGSTEQR